jgi:protein phosphatase 1L
LSSASVYRSFNILTGHGGSRAAEYLKEHLFENLMKHPEFMTNTKLAISMISCIAYSIVRWLSSIWPSDKWHHAGETYKKTDSEFLDAERTSHRDDGSTASTAILMGDHLYVANVGDSRTVISKAGKGAFITHRSVLI